MHKLLSWLSAAGLCALAAGLPIAARAATSATTPAAAPAGSTERLAQVAQSFARSQHFSGTVLVARGDSVLFSQGFGLASPEWGIANAPDVKFLLASVSKQFTAAAVLRLVDQGRLKLDDPLRLHLPDTPAAWNAVTVRHLLSHSSGIPNHTAGTAFNDIKQQAMTPRQLLATFRELPLDFAPGSTMNYSNSGYVLLGLLVEQLSGQSWGDFVARELLVPLGMAHSGIASSEALTPRLATGLRSQGPKDAPRLVPASFLHMSVPYAAGALYGTTGDLLKWQRGLYGGAVLQPSSLKAMTTPVRPGVALGLMVGGSGEQTVYSHSGGINGFSTFLQYEPKTQLSIAVLSNIEGAPVQAFTRKLSAVANGKAVVLPEERKPVALPEAALQAVEGAYQLAPGQVFRVVRRGQRLWARMNQEAWTPLVPESELAFFAPEVDADARFARAPDGRITSVTHVDIADNKPWLRVDLPMPSLAAQPIYLRGSMNQWSTRDRLAPGADGLHRITLPLPAGEHELKVASEDWGVIDLGQQGQAAALPGQGVVSLVGAGGNIALKLRQASQCRFEVDGRDIVEPRLQVTCTPQ